MIGNLTRLILVGVDILFVQLGMIIAFMLRFETIVPEPYKELCKEKSIILEICMLTSFIIFRLYRSLWRYASVRELLQVIGACLTGVAAFIFFSEISGSPLPRCIYVLYLLVLIPLIISTRFGYRILRKIWRKPWQFPLDLKSFISPDEPKLRVLLVGAGQAGSIVVKELNSSLRIDRDIVVAVDDNKSKQGARLHGILVKGGVENIPELVEQYQVQEIIVAMPSISKRRLSEILEICNETNCKLRVFRGIDDALDKKKAEDRKSNIRDVKVEDLLGREEIVLSNEKLKVLMKDQVVLVTGGGGSIGSELCRQIINLSPRLLVVVDIYENNAYDLQMELIQQGIPRERIKMIIASVRDQEKLKEIFETYRPSFVFHAAAHKHVPLMEDSPSEAIKNNVFGTLNVAQCAIAYKAKKFVLVSTDKAVNPTNVMGATKRVCEMIIQAMNTITVDTDFVAVRFGNVLGSNGSVIPLFRKQMEAGGPLTVTHPDIIRYFMTIPEAVRLILEATSFATGGEIFVLDMGKPVKIVDLAKNLIKLSGLKLNEDICIEFTGLRPGEKLYEELLMSEEGLRKTQSDKIFIGKPGEVTYEELMVQLEHLRNTMEEKGDIRAALMRVVPTYQAPGYSEKVGGLLG